MRPGEDATEAKVGDIVTSKWSDSGAHWRIQSIEIPAFSGRTRTDPATGMRTPVPMARLVSTTSGRHDSRYLTDMVIVTKEA